MRSFPLVLIAASLAGCNTAPPPPTAQSVLDGMTSTTFDTYQDGFDAAIALNDRIDASLNTNGLAQKADLPTSGVAGYEGFMRIEELNNAANSASGQLLLAVDFGAPAGEVVAGRGFNFYDSVLNPVAGDVTFSAGSFIPLQTVIPSGTLYGEGVRASYVGALTSSTNVESTVSGTAYFGFTNGTNFINGSLEGISVINGVNYDTTGSMIGEKQ